MKRYRQNPKKPRRLTAVEARRLDAARIDYSDIPPLDPPARSHAAWRPLQTAPKDGTELIFLTTSPRISISRMGHGDGLIVRNASRGPIL